MCNRLLPAWALGVLLAATISALAQDIDANPSAENRNPATVADQILDPAERRDFLGLFQPVAPVEMLLCLEDKNSQWVKQQLQSWPLATKR
jgi:hypothetical protein